MVSTPPASTASACPLLISAIPEEMAWLLEMHAMVTVCAGTELGIPAAKPTSRAMFDVRTVWGAGAVTTRQKRRAEISGIC